MAAISSQVVEGAARAALWTSAAVAVAEVTAVAQALKTANMRVSLEAVESIEPVGTAVDVQATAASFS